MNTGSDVYRQPAPRPVAELEIALETTPHLRGTSTTMGKSYPLDVEDALAFVHEEEHDAETAEAEHPTIAPLTGLVAGLVMTAIVLLNR